MISMMDMTTGVWESDCIAAPDPLCVPGAFAASPQSCPVNLLPQAVLGEYSAVRPLSASVPMGAATQDWDDFFNFQILLN